jgi:hypothetical protein
MMSDGEELINFASEVLSRSMKIYGSQKVKEKNVKRFNYSLQVGGSMQ